MMTKLELLQETKIKFLESNIVNLYMIRALYMSLISVSSDQQNHLATFPSSHTRSAECTNMKSVRREMSLIRKEVLLFDIEHGKALLRILTFPKTLP